jgi:hypothetical protein
MDRNDAIAGKQQVREASKTFFRVSSQQVTVSVPVLFKILAASKSVFPHICYSRLAEARILLVGQTVKR